MRLDRIAVWTDDLERPGRSYEASFGATRGPRHTNPAKGFGSCHLGFPDGTRLEARRTTTVPLSVARAGTQPFGLAHMAFALAAVEQVDALVRRLREAGVAVLDGPRRTGDGDDEAVVLDPDGNRLEITA